MTTKITVDAHAGWPVRVSRIEKGVETVLGEVAPKTKQDFYCWDGADLRVHEVQPNETTTMDFGDAVRALKGGKRVARAGWNGKGMFLLLIPGSKGLTVDEGRPLAKAGLLVGTKFNYLPHIDMWTAQGDFVPWLASQTDVLADDWQIIEADAA